MTQEVYEYRWYVGTMYGVDVSTDEYLTEDEVAERKLPFKKLEETKQVRKC